MKIFKTYGKVNFVDENNVFVGYDTYHSCCEDFGWRITRNIPIVNSIETNLSSDIDESDLEGFIFDKSFIKNLDSVSSQYCGGAICFRLTNDDEEIFLTLWNYHNGYYAHGFEFVDNDKIILKSVL